MRIDLSGKTALVTGASRGIGEAIARRLADCGRPLIVWNRSPDRAKRLAAQVNCAIARTPAELASGSDIVISSLADSHAVNDGFGEGGKNQVLVVDADNVTGAVGLGFGRVVMAVSLF